MVIKPEIRQRTIEIYERAHGVITSAEHFLKQEFGAEAPSETYVKSIWKKEGLETKRIIDAIRIHIKELYKKFGENCPKIRKELQKRIPFYNIGDHRIKNYITEMKLNPNRKLSPKKMTLYSGPTKTKNTGKKPGELEKNLYEFSESPEGF